MCQHMELFLRSCSERLVKRSVTIGEVNQEGRRSKPSTVYLFELPDMVENAAGVQGVSESEQAASEGRESGTHD